MRARLLRASFVLVLAVAAVAATPPARPAPAADAIPTVLPGVERIVAIGDLHGDRQALDRALRLAGAVDEAGRWVGGKLVVVITGDMIDRGDDDRGVLDAVAALRTTAAAAGGAVVPLLGNHELLNVAGELRYVSPVSLRQFADVPGLDLSAPAIQARPAAEQERAAAFAPGGPYAHQLSPYNLVQIVGDTLFVHGGVLPHHVRGGLPELNDRVRRWLRGLVASPREIVEERDSPAWLRIYSYETGRGDCQLLKEVLRMLSLRRMVVGHTTQKTGISPACDGLVWRIDTGLSRHYRGPLQVLEIEGEKVRVLEGEAPD